MSCIAPAARSLALLAGVAVLLLGADEGERGAQDLPGLAYVEGGAPARTLDLYLPAPAVNPPPLVVFVHSRFWAEAPGGPVLVDGFAKPLQRAGAAVAIVRHRLAPEHRHPDPADDVAAALAFLLRSTDRYGFDPARLFLAGHAAGGHLASLLALDPRYLERHGVERSALAGVIALSGIYDLEAQAGSDEERTLYERAFGDAARQRAASPVSHLRPDAPRFLLLVAEQDVPGYAGAAEAFAAALRDAGHPDAESYVIGGRDHASIVDLALERTGTRLHVLDFIGLEPLPPVLAEARRITRYWRKPRFSTEPFWTSGAPVKSHAADARFAAAAGAVFQTLLHQRRALAPQRFHAIDLFDLLDALGPTRVGTGPWLTITNVLREKTYVDLERIRMLDPVVVIGIDGERNLFRKVDVHRARREYSWRDDLPAPPFVARPMGAFLYMLDPRSSQPTTLTHFSIDISGFARSEEDPLAGLRDVGEEVLWTLTGGRGCVSCHSFRGVGSRSGHLRAVDAEPQGGYALALEEYPREVWRRFVFQPGEAAALLQAPHPSVRGRAAVLLFEVVERARRPMPAASAVPGGAESEP